MQATTSETTPLYPEENEQFWTRHAKSLKNSGLSRTAYCKQNNINYHRFSYWLQKTSGSTSPLIAVKLKSANELPVNELLCTLSTGNGWHLKIHHLQALSLVLEKVGVVGC